MFIVFDSITGKMLYEWVELEVYKVANEFGAQKLTVKQFQDSLEDISEKCNIVLNCLSPIEHPTHFEEMILKSTKNIKFSALEVCKNLTGLG